jgi:hypothetical protein
MESKLISLGTLPAGDRGVEITVKKLIDLIEEGTRDPVIIKKAREIVRKAGARNAYERAKAIFNWVKRNIRYVRDPRGLELIRPARKILEDRIGDCDEHVVLSASMYRAVGLPVALVTISTPLNPTNFSHIYTAVKTGPIWFPSDTIIPGFKFGDQYPKRVRIKIWKVDSEVPSINELSGWWDTIKKAATSAWRKIREIGQKAVETGRQTIRQEVSSIIEEQKKKAAQDIQKVQTENVLMWSLVIITLLVLAWFLSRR